MNRPIDPESEVTYLFPDEIILLQARQISKLEDENDRLLQVNDWLKSDKQAYQAALVTLILFFLVIALICLVGTLG
jgi:ABC-type lipoprotein release transport system permease subunit